MECVKANQIDLVDYLHFLGCQPLEIKDHEHWYLSPFRHETVVSFKVDKLKNQWYNHGIGKSGNIIEFIVQLINCDQTEALKIISSFDQQKNLSYNPEETRTISVDQFPGSTIKLLATKRPITDFFFAVI